MRHKYETRGLILSRSSVGEASAFVTLLTPELGLLRARVQGARMPGAKLAAALATFAESSVVLVRGREGWRLAGAVLEENWFRRLAHVSARERAGRICGLLLRLVAGEAKDPDLFAILSSYFNALSELPHSRHETAEILVALRILASLGLDKGEIPGTASTFNEPLLSSVASRRSEYIGRINYGIAASGL